MALKEEKIPKEEKKNWYNDRYQFVVVQRNTLAVITILALVCSIAATYSISQLAPLKSVEPFVIQVDQKSGITQAVNPLQARDLTANEAVNQYFIVQYCRARETFLGTQDKNYYNYNLVRILSDPSIFSKYQREIVLSNPESPGARLGANGERSIHIASIKSLDSKTLQDGTETRRYLIIAQISEKGGNGPAKVLQKIITLEFKYAELVLNTEDRYLNPLGFRVLDYRVDENNLTQ